MKCQNQQCQREIEEVLFCPYCGTRQEKPKLFCVYCGVEMDEDAVYCNNCGKKSFLIQQKEEEERRRQESEAERKRLEEEQRKIHEELDQRTGSVQEDNMSDFKELMADLIPDIIQKKEKLDMHLFFVKKIAHNSGWDEDEVATALSDFLSMYGDFKQEHTKGEAFSNNEKKLLTYQAGLAHIDQSILDEIL